MQSINRTGVVIKPKQPFVDWLNSIPGENSDNNLGNMPTENTTFLIPEFFCPKESMTYVKKIYSQLFESHISHITLYILAQLRR